MNSTGIEREIVSAVIQHRAHGEAIARRVQRHAQAHFVGHAHGRVVDVERCGIGPGLLRDEIADHDIGRIEQHRSGQQARKIDRAQRIGARNLHKPALCVHRAQHRRQRAGPDDRRAALAARGGDIDQHAVIDEHTLGRSQARRTEAAFKARVKLALRALFTSALERPANAHEAAHRGAAGVDLRR